MFSLVQGSYKVSSGGGGSATTTFTPDTSSRFVNPETGPYGWAYTGSSNGGVGGTWIQNFTSSNLSGMRTASFPRTLVMGFIDLTSNRSSNLTTTQLNQVSAGLAAARGQGLSVIIRGAYNYDGNGAEASLAQMQTHMSQLAPIWAANEDVCTAFQLGWAGAYAEYHDGSQGIDQTFSGRIALMNTLMANTPTGCQIQARYPADIMTWFPTVLTESQYLAGLTSPTNQTRLGFFNDGYLAGSNDSGTFANRSVGDTTSFSQTQMQNYTAAMTAFTLAGGEVTTYAGTPFRTAYSDATGDGSKYHFGFLNFEYNSGPQFFDAWASNGADQQISKYYGYRLQLDSLTYPVSTIPKGSSAAFTAGMRNNGYARVPRARYLTYLLRHTSTGEIYSATGDDLRKLPANASSSTSFSSNVTIPSGATSGVYQVLLSAPSRFASLASDVRYASRFANANNGSQQWDATNGRFNTGVTVTVA